MVKDSEFDNQYEDVVAEILGGNEVNMVYLAKLMVTAPFSGKPFPLREDINNRLDKIIGEQDHWAWWLEALRVATGFGETELFEDIAGLASGNAERRRAAIEKIKLISKHREFDSFIPDKLWNTLDAQPSATVRYCIVTALMLLTNPCHDHRCREIITDVWIAIPQNTDLFRESFDWLIAALFAPMDIITIETGDIGGHGLPKYLSPNVLHGNRELTRHINACAGQGRREAALAEYMRDCVG